MWWPRRLEVLPVRVPQLAAETANAAPATQIPRQRTRPVSNLRTAIHIRTAHATRTPMDERLTVQVRFSVRNMLLHGKCRPSRRRWGLSTSLTAHLVSIGSELRQRGTVCECASSGSTRHHRTSVCRNVIALAGPVHQLCDPSGELPDLLDHIRGQCFAFAGTQRRPCAVGGHDQQLEVGAQRGQRGEQLVAGVDDQGALMVTRVD